MDRREAQTPEAPSASVGGTALTPGDHVCVLHRGRSERTRLVAPFVADGLRQGHSCLLLAAKGEGRTFRDVLARQTPTLDGHTGRLQVKEPEDNCLRDGDFDGERMLALLRAWSERLLPVGEGAFGRLAADMSWARPLVGPAFVHDLIRYEREATRWLASSPRVGLCTYDLDLFGGDVIVPVVTSHPLVWFNGVLLENPYSSGPTEARTGARWDGGGGMRPTRREGARVWRRPAVRGRRSP